MSTPEISWRCLPFADLRPDELYAALQLRQRVFVVEQRCAYLDADGSDDRALHLFGWTAGRPPRLAAYARLFPPGVKAAEPSVGRVATHPDFRGSGIGKALMAESLAQLERAGWSGPVWIQAQIYLERFYEGFGFHRVTEPYLEDDIVHVDMLRP